MRHRRWIEKKRETHHRKQAEKKRYIEHGMVGGRERERKKRGGRGGNRTRDVNRKRRNQKRWALKK